MKIARTTTGEHYIECPIDLWEIFLQAREKDETQPSPMPVGHMMFRKPETYGITMVFDLRQEAMIEQAKNILKNAATA